MCTDEGDEVAPEGGCWKVKWASWRCPSCGSGFLVVVAICWCHHRLAHREEDTAGSVGEWQKLQKKSKQLKTYFLGSELNYKKCFSYRLGVNISLTCIESYVFKGFAATVKRLHKTALNFHWMWTIILFCFAFKPVDVVREIASQVNGDSTMFIGDYL